MRVCVCVVGSKEVASGSLPQQGPRPRPPTEPATTNTAVTALKSQQSQQVTQLPEQVHSLVDMVPRGKMLRKLSKVLPGGGLQRRDRQKTECRSSSSSSTMACMVICLISPGILQQWSNAAWPMVEYAGTCCRWLSGPGRLFRRAMTPRSGPSCHLGLAVCTVSIPKIGTRA